MVSADDIVITGLGITSPIGVGVDAFWSSLKSGTSGVGALEEFRDSVMPVKFGGEVRDFNPKLYVKPRKSLKVMSREIQMGVSAAVLATEHAQLETENIDSDRLGVVLGCDFLYCDSQGLEDAYRASRNESGDFEVGRWGPHGIGKIFPLWMLKFLPNMAACHIGIAIDARGPNNTITQGEASSMLALMESCSVIRRGLADIMLTGGVGTRLNVTPLLYRGDSNLSHRHVAPEQACRPFDADRDGKVNGEGAAILVVERRRHAERRGANILATVLSCSSRFETTIGDAIPSGDGFRNAIQNVLEQAGMEPKDVGHVNADGISTIRDDAVEAQAIQSILGDIPVTATKSFFGNLGGATGAMELAASLLSLQNDQIPQTLNYETPDPACPVNVVAGKPAATDNASFLAMNKSSTGQVAAALIRVE